MKIELRQIPAPVFSFPEESPLIPKVEYERRLKILSENRRVRLGGGLWRPGAFCKFGVDFLDSTVTSYDYYEGNVNRYYYGPDDTMPTGDYWEVVVIRDVQYNQSYRRYGLFIQDTITLGEAGRQPGIPLR